MDKRNQKQVNNKNQDNQLGISQGFEGYNMYLCPIYTFYISYKNISDIISTNNISIDRQQQLKYRIYHSVTTQTIDSQFDCIKQKDIESIISQEINQIQQNKNINIKNQIINNFQNCCIKISNHFNHDNFCYFYNDIQDYRNHLFITMENMLKFYQIDHFNYQAQAWKKQYLSTLFQEIVKFFHGKICTFKKSKEEMIKLIIRKTQRFYKMKNNCKKDQRFKKYGGFKSMNSGYLQRLFSDKNFAQAFKQTMQNFIQKFEEQNKLKLNTFIQKISQSRNRQQFKLTLKSLDEKNRMPWSNYWIIKLKKVIEELQITYIINQQNNIQIK